MAPESESRLNGTSPSNKSIKSVSDSSFTEVQGFLEALTAFTTKAGFNQLKTLFDRVTLQEQELEAKDATIRGMTLNFEQRYQEWKKENEDLRRGTQAMDAALKEKEERKKALNDELRKTTTRVNHLEEAHNVATVTLKNKDLQLGHLEAKFQTAKKASDDLKERLKKAAALTESLENGANENRKLQLEATKSEKLIKEYRGFAKTLEELDLRDMSVLNCA
jgi:chromosome segregation ATPase